VAAIDPIASVEASAVVDAFERVALCASGDEARPVLTCAALFFREDPPALEVVATDSYRLGVAQIPVGAGFRVSDGPLLVPARAVRLVAKQLKGAEGAVQVRALEASGVEPSRASRIAFSLPDAEWTVRTVEGEFPNWKQVVPNPEGGSFEFDPEELGSALRAATSVRSTTGRADRILATDPRRPAADRQADDDGVAVRVAKVIVDSHACTTEVGSTTPQGSRRSQRPAAMLRACTVPTFRPRRSGR
jgi:DNA polymerase III sliding clamp (beta) subunit (PCNA family)